MKNSSIYAAFERMWQHVVALVGSKANTDHTHDDTYYTEAEVDAIIAPIDASLNTKAEQEDVTVLQGLVGDTAVSEQITDAVSQKSQVQMITGETAEILPTLKIHKLTQDEYDQKFADGVLDENALYLTPDEEMDMSPYATVEELNTKADANHIHEDINASVANLNTLVGDARVSDQIAEAIAKRSQVQIITWEADD